MKFVESDSFQIQMNVTAANTDELAKVQYNYTNYEGSVLLQVVSITAGLLYFFHQFDAVEEVFILVVE